jgi:hypothetical protein
MESHINNQQEIHNYTGIKIVISINNETAFQFIDYSDFYSASWESDKTYEDFINILRTDTWIPIPYGMIIVNNDTEKFETLDLKSNITVKEDLKSRITDKTTFFRINGQEFNITWHKEKEKNKIFVGFISSKNIDKLKKLYSLTAKHNKVSISEYFSKLSMRFNEN